MEIITLNFYNPFGLQNKLSIPSFVVAAETFVLCLVTEYGFFLQKEIKKMPSVAPFTFNAFALKPVIINEKLCILPKEVCKALKNGTATKATDIVRCLSGK